MPIEFHCTHCGRLLRTPDETAGRQAKCPACGSIQPIPTHGTLDHSQKPGQMPREASEGTPSAPPGTGSEPPPPGANPFGTTQPHRNATDAEARGAESPLSIPHRPDAAAPPDSDNPYRAPAHQTVEVIPTYRPASLEAARIDLGNVVSDAWRIYTTHFGTCVLIGLIVYVLPIIMSLILFGAFFAVAAAAGVAAGAAGAGGNPADALFIVLIVLGILVFTLIVAWIYIGQTLFLLKLTRGEPASMRALWSGGRYVLSVAAATILWMLASTLGLAACLVPGVLLYLMFSQYYMLIIDREVGIIESLMLSARITNGNKLSLLLLVLMVLGVTMVGAFVPCGVGQIFITPFVALVWISAYLQMTGQSPNRSVASTVVT